MIIPKGRDDDARKEIANLKDNKADKAELSSFATQYQLSSEITKERERAVFAENNLKDSVSELYEYVTKNRGFATKANPNPRQVASIIMSGNTGTNRAFIDRYAIAFVSNLQTNAIKIRGTVTCEKTMNSTTSSSSTGYWKLELVKATSTDFEDYKIVYTAPFDNQTDLITWGTDSEKNHSGTYVCTRSPSFNIDTINIDMSIVTNANEVYALVLTYGTTGLGYYANQVVSTHDIEVTQREVEITLGKEYRVDHKVLHLPEYSELHCAYTIKLDAPNVPVVATTTPEIRSASTTKFYYRGYNEPDLIDVTDQVTNKTGNPTYNERSYFFGSGNNNNQNSVTYEVLGNFKQIRDEVQKNF